MLQKVLPNNEAMWERAARVVLGLGAVSMVFVGPQTPFGWLGVIPLVTGLIGSCPIYTALGVSTKK